MAIAKFKRATVLAICELVCASKGSTLVLTPRKFRAYAKASSAKLLRRMLRRFAPCVTEEFDPRRGRKYILDINCIKNLGLCRNSR